MLKILLGFCQCCSHVYQKWKETTTLKASVTFSWRSALLLLVWNSNPEYLEWEKRVCQSDISGFAIMFLPFILKMQKYSVHADIHLFLFKRLLPNLWSNNFSFQNISPKIVTLTKPTFSHQTPKHQTSHLSAIKKEALGNAFVCTWRRGQEKLTLHNILVDFGSRRFGNLSEEGLSLITASCDPRVKGNFPKQR